MGTGEKMEEAVRRPRIDWLVCAMLMSPDGPEQAKYRANLERRVADGMQAIHMSWGPEASRLAVTYEGREQLFKMLNDCDADIAAKRYTVLDFADRRLRKCGNPKCACANDDDFRCTEPPHSGREPVNVAEFVKQFEKEEPES